MTVDYDVAVVGASVAGCTAARLFGQAGARVALIERREDPDAYKVVCTHAVLPPATATIERLGLAPKLLERGVPRTTAQFWTPYGGWIDFPEALSDGWGVTRRTLDPALRELAASTPGVELLAGRTAKRVISEAGRPAGIEVEDRGHRTEAIRARLVVGADGRGSTVARLAGIRGRVRPHNRFFYFAYWRGIEPVRSAGKPAFRLWVLDPEGAAEFPNEDGLTVLVTGFHRSRLAEVRADPEGAYERALSALPDGPAIDRAERVSKLLGKLEMPNVMRPAGRPGIAFVGDAALATDPLFGVGLTFAFQSATWLVDETSAVLDDRAALDRALRRYARKFVWRIGPHHLQIADFATARRMRPLEKRTFRRATTDSFVARTLGEVLGRERSPLHLFDPRLTARILLPQRS
jgi:2-polyprenyl-6-methoxyphenol hydroxylase-like FAD-dependent oxidoreductase